VNDHSVRQTGFQRHCSSNYRLCKPELTGQIRCWRRGHKVRLVAADSELKALSHFGGGSLAE